MFKLAFLVGLYASIIYLLGLQSLINRELLILSSVLFLAILVLSFKSEIANFKLTSSFRNFDKFGLILIALIFAQSVVNFIGVLGPELAFDALWYHLTIPKIYLQQNSISYIGGHLYYSAMPQLTEMLYLVGLALGNEIVVKLIHFIFGIGILIALYKMSRLFLDKTNSLLVTLVFYSNLVVSWMAMTAYIDLARTFFEVLALWAFLIFIKESRLMWLVLSATMIGFAASTKLLSLESIGIYIILIFYFGVSKKAQLTNILKYCLIYASIAVLIVSPWLLYSYINTGYPFFPFFSPLHSSLVQLDPPIGIMGKILAIFLLSPDPISPVYFISLPLCILFLFKYLYSEITTERRMYINMLLIYITLGFGTVWTTALAGSGRYFLPYLTAFSLLFVLFLTYLKSKFLYRSLILVVIFISISSIGYRALANKRFIPVILGLETKSSFLANNLEFNVGNFYDVDNYFKENVGNSRVLIYGISNLYYVNFPYIHESWVKKGDEFEFILLKDMPLPEQFKDWELVYQNNKTRVKLYSKPQLNLL